MYEGMKWGGGGGARGGGINIRAIEGTGGGGREGRGGERGVRDRRGVCVERREKDRRWRGGGRGVRRGKDLQEDVGKRAEVYERAERRKSVARLWGESMLSLVTLVL